MKWTSQKGESNSTAMASRKYNTCLGKMNYPLFLTQKFLEMGFADHLTEFRYKLLVRMVVIHPQIYLNLGASSLFDTPNLSKIR